MPSYSPVFSQGFIYYIEATPDAEFDVPLGYTAVVRDISASVSAGATYFAVYGRNGPDAPEYQFYVNELLGTLETSHWEGRVVVPGGGRIRVYQYTLGVDGAVYVGGYLLRNSLS